jgi:hypothetical protein
MGADMNRRWTLILAGLTCFLLGLGLLVAPGAVYAQDDDDDTEAAPAREYEGVGECNDCHGDIADEFELTGHALTLMETDDEDAQIVADFDSGEDVREVTFPDGQTRAFTLNDVAYAVGSGKYVQRYLYEADENDYKLFPAQWNAVTGEWEDYTIADEWPSAEAYDWEDNCAYCHVTGFDIETGTWEEAGAQCETCHGPGSYHIEVAEDYPFGVPDGDERADMANSIALGTDSQQCGQCHSRGNTPDDHPFPAGYTSDQNLLADDVFSLVSPDSDDHWWPTGQASQPNMQFNEWHMDAHAGGFADLPDGAGAGCLSCHNATYQRAANIVASYEAEEDEDYIETLYDEAELDVDDVDDLEWDELRPATLEALGIEDASFIDPDALFLPQVLPFFIERMHEEGNLEESAIIPQELALLLSEERDFEEHELRAYGVTCSSCHNTHAAATVIAAPTDENGYTTCESCHQSAEPFAGLHHPVKEVYQGEQLISEVDAIEGTHYSAEDGPTCQTCHLPEVPVGSTSRASHITNPIMPGEAMDIEAINDSCTICHEEDPASMQDLIDSVQGNVSSRLETINDELSDDSPEWVANVVDVIEGDGSQGIHNYAYTTAMLAAAENELGLRGGTASVVLPDVATPTPIPEGVAAPGDITATDTGFGDLTMPSIIFLAICTLMILVSAFAFFFQEANAEETQ